MKYTEEIKADMILIEVPTANKHLPDQGIERLFACIFPSDEVHRNKKI